MVTPAPGIYVGTLRHRRFTPTRHQFSYPLFMALLDVDRLAELMRVSPLTGFNRVRWATFDDRDHLGDARVPLRARVEADAARHGMTLDGGPIMLLTHLRYAGYTFNPVSFFYCFASDGRLQAVMAEVNNTYGGRHTYWLPAGQAQRRQRVWRWQAEKALYVSPFIDTDDTRYTFVLSPPGDALVAHMDVREGPTRVLDATLRLARRPWTAPAVHAALLRHPFMTAAVIARIHWQALRLWVKGVPVIPRRTHDGVGERTAESARS